MLKQRVDVKGIEIQKIDIRNTRHKNTEMKVTNIGNRDASCQIEPKYTPREPA